MNQEEFERNKHATEHLVKVANEYLDKIRPNVEAIYEKKIAAKTVAQLTLEITTIIGKLIHEARKSEGDPQEKLSKIVEVLSSLMSSLDSTVKANSEEIVKLEATQEGMRRALEAIRDSGKIRLEELSRIERLSHEEASGLDRVPGERPEKLSTKRNASSLKKSRNPEDS